jgi:hypothetical protein
VISASPDQTSIARSKYALTYRRDTRVRAAFALLSRVVAAVTETSVPEHLADAA